MKKYIIKIAYSSFRNTVRRNAKRFILHMCRVCCKNLLKGKIDKKMREAVNTKNVILSVQCIESKPFKGHTHFIAEKSKVVQY